MAIGGAMASLPRPPAAGVAVGRQQVQALQQQKEIRRLFPDSSPPPLPTLHPRHEQHQLQRRHRTVVDNRQWQSRNPTSTELELGSSSEMSYYSSLDPQEALNCINLLLSEACSLQQQQQPLQQPGDGGEPHVICWPPTLSTRFVSLLGECVEAGSASSARILHTLIIKTGILGDAYVSTSLVNVYAKCGLMDESRKVFDKMSSTGIVTWTALMTGYAHNHQPEQALRVFIWLLKSWHYPTSHTLRFVLSICSTIYALNLGRQLHAYATKYDVATDAGVANTLSNLYSKCGDVDSGLKVFRSVPVEYRNVILWTTALSACKANGRPNVGLRLFADMLGQQGEAEGSRSRPNEFTLTSAMSLCSTTQSLDLGKQIHSLCIRLGCSKGSIPIRASIMYFYLKCGCVEEARSLIKDFTEPDEEESLPSSINLVTYNAMIAGFSQVMDDLSFIHGDYVAAHAQGMEALNIFAKLNRRVDMRPDIFSYSSVLTICSGLAALDQGEQFHAQVIKTGCLSNPAVGSSLVNMYSKCGMIQKAINAFAEMPYRTLISWTTMISSYSQHGRHQEAIQLFEDMMVSGVIPNGVTFVALLSACSQGGMVDQAHHYFRLMTEKYGIKPQVDHYACMVDMYVRLSRLEEAFDIIDTKMPFEPNEVIWSIVIAGCKCLGRMDLALQASQRLLQLKPMSLEAYTLLLKTYASAKKWPDVSRVRKLMKDEKIRSLKEISWITIKERVYSFRPNDKSNTRSPEMYKLLEELISRAKPAGNAIVADDYSSGSSTRTEQLLDPDVDQQPRGKKPDLVHHSEKLAFAFGLLNTPSGTPIRIMKNNTICMDCHGAMKMFSALTGREVCIRDSKRLHRFFNGNCSCGVSNTFF